jgi:hypothetical protein
MVAAITRFNLSLKFAMSMQMSHSACGSESPRRCRFLSGKYHLITRGFYLGHREIFIGQFGFLQVHQIGRAGGEKIL